MQAQFLSVEEFDTYVDLPENADKLFEYIGGELFEAPSNPYVSKIAMLFGALILAFARENKLGHVTGEAGGYMVSGERYAPDVGYISYDKQPELAKEGYNPSPPDLAVEVVSSDRSDELHKLRIKITNYLAAGTVVWVVKPEARQVEVHVAEQAVTIYRGKDTLPGSVVLPGLAIKLSDVFGG